jgi:two-component system nitrogen regulation sensor histidine kinase NtrY
MEQRPSATEHTAHERRILALALAAGAPALIAAVALLFAGGYSARLKWSMVIVLIGLWVSAAVLLRDRVARPLRTLSNMLAAIREGDYSMRARGAGSDDALAQAFLESNLLGETLRARRLDALEATTLLRMIVAEIDVAVIAFDAFDQVRLANRAAERLLGSPAEELIGRGAADVGLAAYLTGESPRTVDAAFAGPAGRWEVRRSGFRQDGRPHTLLVLTDLSKTLREEELLAWQRLVRVLGHEINNSLAPIKSIAGSLRAALDRAQRPGDVDDDLRRGLDVIADRSDALARFLSAYARLARLPAPRRAPLEVGAWVRRVALLETRLPVVVTDGPPTVISADSDQLDQLLINLVRNGADAALETRGAVRVRWDRAGDSIYLAVEDDGPGVSNSANLFVPFFTTKPQGSGIGLVLARQIAEAHGGTLLLENRTTGSGCIATVRLPVAA